MNFDLKFNSYYKTSADNRKINNTFSVHTFYDMSITINIDYGVQVQFYTSMISNIYKNEQMSFGRR